ncbi:MAG: hypothetical protein ACMXYK_00165 [Candidatus Woesearchaeota archaeon]
MKLSDYIVLGTGLVVGLGFGYMKTQVYKDIVDDTISQREEVVARQFRDFKQSVEGYFIVDAHQHTPSRKETKERLFESIHNLEQRIK